jgi:hypothetical protein
MFLEIVPIQYRNMVVLIVLVQDLIQFYVMFLTLHVQVKKNQIFDSKKIYEFQ